MHSQMEWEDDIGLNITVNPLDETKVGWLEIFIFYSRNHYVLFILNRNLPNR